MIDKVIEIELLPADRVMTRHVHQWDIGQIIKVTDIEIADGTPVDFGNRFTNEGLRAYMIENQVTIPAPALQQDRDLTGYVVVTDENSETTVKEIFIPVTPKPKPEDYVGEEIRESTEFQYIVQKAEEAEENAAAAKESAENAAASEQAAKESAENAAASEQAAKESAENAAASEQAAKEAQTAAENATKTISENVVATQAAKEAAETAATNAGNSANAAANSADDADTSATQAENAATSAANSAIEAAKSAAAVENAEEIAKSIDATAAEVETNAKNAENAATSAADSKTAAENAKEEAQKAADEAIENNTVIDEKITELNSEEYKESIAEKVPFIKTAEQPEFANSIDECTDTSKIYVLPDGYLYAYMTTTIEGGTEEVVVDVTDGFSDNTRLSVSSGNTSTLSGFVTTPFIDFSQYPIDAEIRLSGVNWAADSNNSNGYAYVVYDDEQAFVRASYMYLGEHYDDTANTKYVASDNDNVIFTLHDLTKERNFKSVRFCGNGTAANAVVQIVYTQETEPQTVTEWTNTGHAFVPADYEDRIVTLEEDSANYETRLKLLEANTDVSGVPDYWIDELEAKADTIQQVMETAGRNKSAFIWYTDAHWKYTNAKVSPLLLEYLWKNTAMNKVNFGGDVVSDPTELTHEQIPYVYEWRKMVKALPNHHSVIGNHDNFHMGRNDSEVSDLVYSFLIATEESDDMVMGDDFYYYIDNSCEKTRYIYLDSGRFNLSDDETEWLIGALKSVQSGWHIVVISHIWFQYTSSSEPTVGAVNSYMKKALDLFDDYNARQSGSVTMVSTEKTYDFTACDGKIEFCIGGHIHVDYDFESDGGIPVIITASDTNQPRGTNETACGTIGTVTESAVYGIIADYDNSTVTVVGVGRGTSRTISY